MLLLELLVIGWVIYKFCMLFESAPSGGFEDEDLDLLYLAEMRDSDPDLAQDLGFHSGRQFEETFVGRNLVSAEDMALLNDAGYDPTDVEFMEPGELKDAMEDAGVDTDFYDFDE